MDDDLREEIVRSLERIGASYQAFQADINRQFRELTKRVESLEAADKSVETTTDMLRSLQRDMRDLRDRLARPRQEPASGLLN